MTCRDFLTRYSEYVDGRIDAAEAELLGRHAESCAACRRYDRVVRTGAQLARDLLPRVRVSEDFEPRVRHRLLDAGEHVSRRRAGSASVYAAAASVVVIAAAAALFTLPVPSVSSAEPATVRLAAAPTSTPVREKTRATTRGPALPTAWPKEVAAAAEVIVAELEARDAHAATPAGWPVYTRSAMAAAFPAAYTALVVHPAEFRHASSRSRAAGPLLVRH